MTTTTAPMWQRQYEQYFGKRLYDGDAMAACLTIELTDWDGQDIIDTMRWMTSQEQAGKWPKEPRGKAIAKAHRTRLKQERQARDGTVAGDRAGLVNELKARIRRAMEADEWALVWDTVCDGDYQDAHRRRMDKDGVLTKRNHIVALSGGKDSTCLALWLRENRPSVDCTYVCTPTGNELPEMQDHWRKLECMLGKRLVSVTDMTLRDLIMKYTMLPNARARFCTRVIKIQRFQKWLMDHRPATVYIGLRADEESREGGVYGMDDVTVEYPLRDVGMDKRAVIEYLRERNVAIPRRTDCAVCFYQTLCEWWRLWRDHRPLFNEGVEWERVVSERRGKSCTLRSASRDTWPAGLAELGTEFEKGRVPKSRHGIPANQTEMDMDDERDAMCSFCAR